jgi:E3 ubiquitin-protein ligase RNFT1
VSIRIVAPDEVGASFERADEVIFEEEEDDGQTTRTRPEDPSPITSGVESGRESSFFVLTVRYTTGMYCL